MDRVALIFSIRTDKEGNTSEVWEQQLWTLWVLLCSNPTRSANFPENLGRKLSKLPYSIDISTSNIFMRLMDEDYTDTR